MRTRLPFIAAVVVIALSVAASQIISVDAGARSVSTEDRLSIEQPKGSGQWKGRDVAVEYSYSINQGQMDISGKIRFASFFIGYSRLQDFRLGAIFVDEKGTVLEEIGLTTDRGSFDPIPFSRTIKLPPNAVSMAFSYQGDAVQSGMGGVTSFSFYPVH